MTREIYNWSGPGGFVLRPENNVENVFRRNGRNGIEMHWFLSRRPGHEYIFQVVELSMVDLLELERAQFY